MFIKFLEDKFFDGNLIFEKGKVYEISEENGWADRWIRRGGIVVSEMPIENKKIEPPVEEVQTEAVQPIASVESEVEEPKFKGPKKRLFATKGAKIEEL